MKNATLLCSALALTSLPAMAGPLTKITTVEVHLRSEDPADSYVKHLRIVLQETAAPTADAVITYLDREACTDGYCQPECDASAGTSVGHAVFTVTDLDTGASQGPVDQLLGAGISQVTYGAACPAGIDLTQRKSSATSVSTGFLNMGSEPLNLLSIGSGGPAYSASTKGNQVIFSQPAFPKLFSGYVLYYGAKGGQTGGHITNGAADVYNNNGLTIDSIVYSN